jgi:hypothetical protein
VTFGRPPACRLPHLPRSLLVKWVLEIARWTADQRKPSAVNTSQLARKCQKPIQLKLDPLLFRVLPCAHIALASFRNEPYANLIQWRVDAGSPPREPNSIGMPLITVEPVTGLRAKIPDTIEFIGKFQKSGRCRTQTMQMGSETCLLFRRQRQTHKNLSVDCAIRPSADLLQKHIFLSSDAA